MPQDLLLRDLAAMCNRLAVALPLEITAISMTIFRSEG
jgi:hypothetical protein